MPYADGHVVVNSAYIGNFCDIIIAKSFKVVLEPNFEVS